MPRLPIIAALTLAPLFISAASVDFSRDVRPILATKCYAAMARTRTNARPTSAWTSARKL